MRSNRQRHDQVFRISVERPVERSLAESFIAPGSRVLDIGTAATGRSALLLRDAGAEVFSVELLYSALVEFAALREPGVRVVCADMRNLPFADASFDSVMIAFHGFDYVTSKEERGDVLRQLERVVRPGGTLIFDAFNRVGLVGNPGGLRHRTGRRLLARHLATFGPFRGTFVDANGLRLYQATPRSVIRHVEATTRFRLERITDPNGASERLIRLTLLAADPYFVFRRAA